MRLWRKGEFIKTNTMTTEFFNTLPVGNLGVKEISLLRNEGIKRQINAREN